MPFPVKKLTTNVILMISFFVQQQLLDNETDIKHCRTEIDEALCPDIHDYAYIKGYMEQGQYIMSQQICMTIMICAILNPITLNANDMYLTEISLLSTLMIFLEYYSLQPDDEKENAMLSEFQNLKITGCIDSDNDIDDSVLTGPGFSQKMLILSSTQGYQNGKEKVSSIAFIVYLILITVNSSFLPSINAHQRPSVVDETEPGIEIPDDEAYQSVNDNDSWNQLTKEQLKNILQEIISKDLKCPISLELLRNPVLLSADGHTYEKEVIERWLKSHNTSPISHEEIITKTLIPNRIIRKIIDESILQHFRSASDATHQEAPDIEAGLGNTLKVPLLTPCVEPNNRGACESQEEDKIHSTENDQHSVYSRLFYGNSHPDSPNNDGNYASEEEESEEEGSDEHYPGSYGG